MRPTIDNIAETIKQESQCHGLLPETVRVDIPRQIEVPGINVGFDHEIRCRCEHAFVIHTQHSGGTPGGALECNQAVLPDFAEHVLKSTAKAIYELHEPKH